MKRSAIIEAARKYEGVPWHHAARSRFGMDCVGLLVMVARDLGIAHVDDTQYPIRPRRGRLHASLHASGLVPVPADDARPGDVLSFLCPRLSVPYHVGIMAEREGRETLIHSMRHPGKVAEVSFDGEWRELHEGTWRYPGAVD